MNTCPVLNKTKFQEAINFFNQKDIKFKIELEINLYIMY